VYIFSFDALLAVFVGRLDNLREDENKIAARRHLVAGCYCLMLSWTTF
jgi:hypothetical protein